MTFLNFVVHPLHTVQDMLVVSDPDIETVIFDHSFGSESGSLLDASSTN